MSSFSQNAISPTLDIQKNTGGNQTISFATLQSSVSSPIVFAHDTDSPTPNIILQSATGGNTDKYVQMYHCSMNFGTISRGCNPKLLTATISIRATTNAVNLGTPSFIYLVLGPSPVLSVDQQRYLGFGATVFSSLAGTSWTNGNIDFVLNSDGLKQVFIDGTINRNVFGFVMSWELDPILGYGNYFTGTWANNTSTRYTYQGVGGATVPKITGTYIASPIEQSATNVTATSMTANWSASADTTSFFLDVATDSGFINFVSGYNSLSVGSATSQAVVGLSANTTYYYRVSGTGVLGLSGYSCTITTLTLTGVPVATPASHFLSAGFSANWLTPVGGVASYKLDIATDIGFTSYIPGFQDLTVSVLTQAVAGLTIGTPYYYRVRGVNATGASASSNVIMAIPSSTLSRDYTASKFWAEASSEV